MAVVYIGACVPTHRHVCPCMYNAHAQMHNNAHKCMTFSQSCTHAIAICDTVFFFVCTLHQLYSEVRAIQAGQTSSAKVTARCNSIPFASLRAVCEAAIVGPLNVVNAVSGSPVPVQLLPLVRCHEKIVCHNLFGRQHFSFEVLVSHSQLVK